MKEDYLWNKTGEDAEIERLENSLQAFRYRETAPPIIPVKGKVLKNQAPRKFFPFAIPAFAGLAITMLVLGIWLNVSKENSVEISADIVQPQEMVLSPDEYVNKPTANPGIKESSVSNIKTPQMRGTKQTAVRKVYRIRKNPQQMVRPHLLLAQHTKKSNPTDMLTKEEKYAYDQLMTALLITGSQLKLVSDKINGIEDQTADIKGAQ